MGLIQNLKFSKFEKNKKDLNNCSKKNENDVESTIDEVLDKILKINELYKEDLIISNVN